MSDRDWRHALRDGLCPLLPTPVLQELAEALASDSPTLTQRVTTYPPAIHGLRDAHCEQACLIGWCGWRAQGLTTTAEVAAWFVVVILHLDNTLGCWSAARLTQFWDKTPRPEALAEALAEVNAVLKARAA